MSRALLTTCALIAGAVVAGFHATAPDCEGWYCLAKGDTPVARQDVRPSVVPAGGRQIGGATAASSGSGQATFASPVFEHEAEPLDQAAPEPPADTVSSKVRRRPAQTESGTAFDGLVAEDLAAGLNDEADTPARRLAAKRAARKAADAWEALVVAALEAPDSETRGRAIGDVGLHRNDDAVAVLLEVATFEIDPNNRLQAVQSLWFSAADGLDRDGSIRSSLQEAARDPDERIAEMAEKALDDLEALERDQADR